MEESSLKNKYSWKTIEFAAQNSDKILNEKKYIYEVTRSWETSKKIELFPHIWSYRLIETEFIT